MVGSLERARELTQNSVPVNALHDCATVCVIAWKATCAPWQDDRQPFSPMQVKLFFSVSGSSNGQTSPFNSSSSFNTMLSKSEIVALEVELRFLEPRL